MNWVRDGATFGDGRYSRAHRWRFDGGAEVLASASPKSVPPPLSVAEAVDPEEAFVAALSSCHMLWFLAIAREQGLVVEEYSDAALGLLAENSQGKPAFTEVRLRPRVTFHGRRPTRAQHEAMHHEAHERCFIANSVTARVLCEALDVTC